MSTYLPLFLAAACTLVGCVDRDVRPYEEFVVDHQRAIDGDFPPTLCSGDSGAPITVRFINRSDFHGTLEWIDADCAPHPVGELRAGASRDEATSVGHAWRLLTPTRVVAEVVIQDGETSVSLGGE